MKKILLVLVLLVLIFAPATPVRAMETNTYSGNASYQRPLEIRITTLRDGDIVVHATFQANSHGVYQLNIFNANDDFVCRSTLDTRGGGVGDMTCSTLGWGGLPTPVAGNYRIEFYPALGGKVFVNFEVTAETNP